MNAVQSEIDAAAGPLPKFDQLAGRVKEELSPTAAVTVDRRKAVVEELRRSEANYLAMMTKAQEVRGRSIVVALAWFRHGLLFFHVCFFHMAYGFLLFGM